MIFKKFHVCIRKYLFIFFRGDICWLFVNVVQNLHGLSQQLNKHPTKTSNILDGNVLKNEKQPKNESHK